jgi:hypothetical protein
MGHGQDVRAEAPSAHATEWLIANGLGGYASGTSGGTATRRTHSLLTAASPHGRLTTLLVAIDERLTEARGAWDLAPGPLAEAPGIAAAHATGRGVIEHFSLDPAPTWRLRAGDVVLEKRVQVIYDHHAVIVSNRHLAGPAARLTLGPCVVCRGPLELQREDPGMSGAAQGVPGRVKIELRPGDPTLMLWHNGAFLPARVWRRGLRYPLDPEARRVASGNRAPAEHGEAAGSGVPRKGRRPGSGRVRRGEAGAEPLAARDSAVETEDALVPGWIDGSLAPGVPLVIVASSEEDLFRRLAAEERLGTPPPRSLAECVALIERENARRADGLALTIIAGADFTARQAASAHNSPMARRRDALVNAGDRWVPSLGRALDRALTRRAQHRALAGALPVPDPEAGHPLRALPALVTLRRFDETRDVLAGAIESIDDGLAPEGYDPDDGTPRHADPEPALWLVAAADVYVRRSNDLEFLGGALYPALESVMQFYRSGTRGVRVGETGLLEIEQGAVVVARADLNALWYHALVAMAQLARLVSRKESGAFYLAWARELRQRFGEQLWDESGGRLFDGLANGVPVPGIRPPHVLAASLQPLVISPDRTGALVDALERDLFTPFGLREHPRSEVTHTSWLGPYYAAYVRSHGRDPAALSRVHDWLEVLRDALGGARFAGVPATYRLDPGGAARAGGSHSTAAAGELLRAWIEELDPSAAPAVREEPVAAPA